MLHEMTAEPYVPKTSVDDIHDYFFEQAQGAQPGELFMCIVRRPLTKDTHDPYAKDPDDYDPDAYSLHPISEEWWIGTIKDEMFVTRSPDSRSSHVLLHAGKHVHWRTRPDADGEHLELVEEGLISIPFYHRYFDPGTPVPSRYVPENYKLHEEIYEPIVLATDRASIEEYLMEHWLMRTNYFDACMMLCVGHPLSSNLRNDEGRYISDLALDLYNTWHNMYTSINTGWTPYCTFEWILEYHRTRSLSSSQQSLRRQIEQKLQKFKQLHLINSPHTMSLPDLPSAQFRLVDFLADMQVFLDATNREK